MNNHGNYYTNYPKQKNNYILPNNNDNMISNTIIFEEKNIYNNHLLINNNLCISRNQKQNIGFSINGINTSIQNSKLNNTNLSTKTKNINRMVINNNIYYTVNNLYNPKSSNHHINSHIERSEPKNKSYIFSNKNKIEKIYPDNKIIKSCIINKHFFEKKSNNKNVEQKNEFTLNELLKDITLYGDLINEEIKEDIKLKLYIPIEEALLNNDIIDNSGYRNENFVLACLAKALIDQGCNVVIEKQKKESEEKINELNTSLQFLTSGLFNFKKYIFYFDFGREKNNILLTNIKEGEKFNMRLKTKLQELFKIKENDILMANPRFPYSITAIIKQSIFNEYSADKLKKELIKMKEFNNLKEIKQSILLSGCKLNTYMIEPRANNKDGQWGDNEIRGGEIYYPPKGWIGYGLRVADRYDNGDNSWLDYDHSEGEWCVAYHGIIGNQHLNKNNSLLTNSLKPGISKQFINHKDYLGRTIGEGIIVTPKPELMEQNCGIFKCCGKEYKIGFMTRVNPKKIRKPKGKDDYWVVNGTDNEIRPYRILIKEL